MSEEVRVNDDFTPIPIEPIDDIVIEPIDFDFSDLDFSDFDFSGLILILETTKEKCLLIKIILCGGSVVQGWNNINPRNNWGMDPDGDGLKI